MDAATALRTRPHLRPRWRDALDAAARQHPLLCTGPTSEALDEADGPAPPQAIVTGIGLCTPQRLSAGVPFDVLGLLLPAEVLRRSVGATTVIALVADAHAQHAGFDGSAVERRSRQMVATLMRVRRRLRLHRLCVVRASDLHATPHYRGWYQTVRARAGFDASQYAIRQVADMACLDEQLGGILKLGWMVGNDREGSRADEAAFDRYMAPWSRRRIPCAYAPAGRTLNSKRIKAPPYVTTDPDARVLLCPREDVTTKLAAAADTEAVNGVRNHLRAIGYAWGRLFGPLRGPLDERVQSMVDRIVRPHRLHQADPR